MYYVDFVDTFSYKLSSTPDTNSPIVFTIPSKRSTGVSDSVSRVVVNTATSTLTINNHGFQVDQPIQYDNGSGETVPGSPGSIAPLQHLSTYYVAEVLNANQIRLKTALNAPNYIVFTAAGEGTSHSFIFVTVNLLENTLYLPNHGLVSGQSVRYDANGNTEIGGLGDAATYYVIKIDDSIIKLLWTL